MNRETAKKIFNQRKNCNEGSWIRHSEYVAAAAQKIAERTGMNQDLAYAMGLLHDIGRSFTRGQFQHITEGYKYMKSLGYDQIARICLTHSFQVQTIYSYVGEIDVPDEGIYEGLLRNIEYDDYDRLIQLCDMLSTSEGYVLVEQRFVKLAFKYGFNEYTLEKWKHVLQLKEYFDRLTCSDVNSLILERV